MSDDNSFSVIKFRALYLKDIRGFKGSCEVKLINEFGRPARWSVLLGNNNTGKTTTLKILAALSYPEIILEFLNKYDLGIYFNKIKKFRKINLQGNFTFQWLTGNRERPMMRPNLFFPYFDYSLYIQRFNEDFSQNKKSISVTDYMLNTLLGYQDNLIIFGYGINRRISEASLSDSSASHPTDNLFNHTELLNIEEWLLQMDYAARVGNNETQEKAKSQFERIKHILIGSQLLPDINDIGVFSSEEFQPYIQVRVHDSWVKLRDLGYGYQSTIAWVVDLAKRMFDRYPDLDNPLHGPAIVLVDEIDLHLHPEWQRKIIKYLSDLFPNTQFIVTAHSPLIVQSAENVNLIMLEKDDETGSINVRQQFGSFQGWTVEEILRELMDMGEKTRSDRYLELMRQFEDGLLAEDYTNVKAAYEELDKILSPSSHQRKVLQIQMSSLIPA